MLNAGGSLAAFAIVVCIAVAFNIMLSNLPVRVDLTEENLYTLSEGSRNILKKLDGTVTLKFFFSAGNPQIPVPVKNYARRVQDLLQEYAIASEGKIVVETYDPKPDSDAEEWAQKYGINGQPIGFMGPTLYIGLVAVMGASEAALPVLDPQSEALLEYNITRMIMRVAHPAKPVVGVMSSLPVLGSQRPPFPMPNQPPPQEQPWFAFADLRKDYDVRQVETTAESIDEEINALVLVHPKDLGEKTLYAIDQFVLRGGHLVAFVDPLSLTESEGMQGMPPQMRFQPKSSSLDKLFDAWGVTFEKDKVVADLEAVSRLRVGPGGAQIEETPVWLSLRKPNMNAGEILTADLENMLMPLAGTFTVAEQPDLEVTPLITSSENAGKVDAMMAQFSFEGVRRNFKNAMTRFDLAVRLHGKLKTAFPDGKPADEKAEDEAEATETPEPDTGSLKESADKSTVVLVGDSDMIYDRMCVQEIGFFGYRAHQPLNDNLAFFFNLVEQMAGSTDLVSVRTRGKTDRPFTVVLDLQRQAQARHLAEETRLQKQLEDAQQRLNELQSQKDQSQQYILSPKQKELIDNTREQVVEAKQALKLVRRKLAQDIEALGIKLKLINILLMPALVAVAGVGFGFYRRSRTSS
jgi:ABC-type uncharacterized transport system involved in gliding motility auxiliary subunit